MGTWEGTTGGTDQGTPPLVPVSVSVSDLSLSGESAERGKPKSKRGTRAPVSDSPEAAAFCERWKLPPPSDPECRSFLDYWGARAGQGGVKLDWTATYRNRPTKDAGRAGSVAATSGYKRAPWLPPKQPAPPPSASATWVDAMERQAEEEAAERKAAKS